MTDYMAYLELWWVKISIVLVIGTILYAVAALFIDHLKVQAAKTKNLFDDAVVGALQAPLNYGILFYVAWYVVDVIEKHFNVSLFPAESTVLIVCNSILFSWFVLRLIRIREHQILKGEIETKSDRTTIGMIFKVLRIIVLVLTVLVVFQTLGISISGLIAFGGVGGAAVAFASRDLLSNFFGALMIFMDKPFSIGDWIRSPERNIEGTVENIGWRMTRIRTFDKRPLYVPNSVFAQISIENPSRMSHRRIYETIGVRYRDFTQVNAICKDIERMLKEHQDIDGDQTLMVNFNKFADSSLEIFIYCFTHTTHWQSFHQIKQRILIEVGDIIERNDASMAFPSHSIYVENNSPELVSEK
jgi:MscS family membrane protein